MVNNNVALARSSVDLCWQLVMLCAVYIGVSMLPSLAFAQDLNSNSIETVFCNVVGMLTSTTGKAIATVAIIAVGIGALLGKISWGMALIVALGIALIFGAGSIVNALAGGSLSGCSSGGAVLNS